MEFHYIPPPFTQNSKIRFFYKYATKLVGRSLEEAIMIPRRKSHYLPFRNCVEGTIFIFNNLPFEIKQVFYKLFLNYLFRPHQ